MRKVIFKIDDYEYFKKEFELEGVNAEESERILKHIKPFKAIYTLYGNGNSIERYELTDLDGNKIDFNSLNGYERGMVLNDCKRYFSSTEHNKPCGVVDIQDMEKITEHTYGLYIYMKLKLNGKEYEISVLFRDSGTTYATSADGTEMRDSVIAAFNELY